MTPIEKDVFINFLVKFGAGWVDISTVKNYFTNYQSSWIVLHKVVDAKCDPNNKLAGITHLRIRRDLLEKLRADVFIAPRVT
jgi:hypothetical protein